MPSLSGSCPSKPIPPFSKTRGAGTRACRADTRVGAWVLRFALLCLSAPIPAATRVKDLVSIEGVRDNQLVGYGVVVGLNKTGDKQQTIFSTPSLANMP